MHVIIKRICIQYNLPHCMPSWACFAYFGYCYYYLWQKFTSTMVLTGIVGGLGAGHLEKLNV